MGLGGFYNHFIFYCKEKTHDFYVVPYCELIEEINGGMDTETFSEKWLECLKTATEEFDSMHRYLWKSIMDESKNYSDLIGALPEDALSFYLKNFGDTSKTKLLTKFQDLQNLALINSEAFLHLIRNFDEKLSKEEYSNDELMTSRLEPYLITSSISMATKSLTSIVSMLQGSLAGEEEIVEMSRSDIGIEEIDHDASRSEQLRWFYDNVKKLDYMDKISLIGHRGFHHVGDRSDNRPVENTLASFEQVWTSGIGICECDVALTKDGKIVMAHDENFSRLALLADCNIAVNKVSDLTLREIFSLPLKGGTRPPLLSDVLRSAAAIGDDCKMVIEIKPGNTEICVPLISMFTRNPGLLKYVAVIMSFDSYIMNELSAQIADLNDILNTASTSHAPSVGRPAMGRASMIHSAYSPQMPAMNRQKSTKNSLLASMMNFDSIVEEEYMMPKLLLVTNSDPTPGKFDTSVKTSFSGLEDVINTCGLDGVYLEHEDAMLEPDGIEAMQALAEKMDVGMWMDAAKHPDKLSLCRDLMNKCDVSWINTDFPQDFFES